MHLVPLAETKCFFKVCESVFKISMYYLGGLEVLVIALEYTHGENVKCKLSNTSKMD